MTIELPPEIEDQLKTKALTQGVVDPEDGYKLVGMISLEDLLSGRLRRPGSETS